MESLHVHVPLVPNTYMYMYMYMYCTHTYMYMYTHIHVHIQYMYMYIYMYVAVPRQDSMSTAGAHAVLSGHCNRFVGYL